MTSFIQGSAPRALPPKKRSVQEFLEDDSDTKPSSVPVKSLRQEETPEALDQFHQAFKVIPDDLKAAYFEAKEKAPHVVETESNPVWFLRFEQCNFWEASKRLATYWRERKNLFGDRAFLPMKDLSGKGALNDCDLRLLRRGAVAILPNDDEGHGVFMFDRRRFQSTDPLDSRRRVCFFLLSLLSETEMSQTEGFVIVALFSMSGGIVDRENLKRFFEYVKAALPFRMKTLIQVSMPPKMEEKTYLQKYMQMILPAVVNQRWIFFKNIMFLYAADSPDLSEKLQGHSLNLKCLPESLGGTWSYASYVQWLFGPDTDWTKGPEEVPPASLPDGGETLYATGCSDTSKPKASAVASREARLGDPEMHEYAQLVGETIDETGYSDTGKPKARPVHTEVTLADCKTHGYTPPEHASGAQRCSYELEQALGLLPGNETTAYMEAVRRSPDLVEPFMFLRYDKFDAWAAARRLAVYWKKRREVFGERAFLPMTQTGEGALSKEDVVLLDTGYLSLLPDDSEGNPVVCYDGSRLPLDLDDDDGTKRWRCLFYTLSVLCERREAPSDGFVAIEIMNSRVKRCENLKDYFVELADNVLPVHLKAVHLVHNPADSERRSFLEIFVPSIMKLCGATAYEKIHVHSERTTEELLENLSTCGFSPEWLPESIGGTWLCLASPKASVETVSGSSTVPEEAKPQPTILSIYSSRKRKRAKERQQYTQDQHDRLVDSNKRVRQSNLRLEKLLADARLVVSQHVPSLSVSCVVGVGVIAQNIVTQQVLDRKIQGRVADGALDHHIRLQKQRLLQQVRTANEQDQASLEAQLRLQQVRTANEQDQASLEAQLRLQQQQQQQLQLSRFGQRHEHPAMAGSLAASLGTSYSTALGTSYSTANAVDSHARAQLMTGLSGLGGTAGGLFGTSVATLQPNATTLDVLSLRRRAAEQEQMAAFAASLSLPLASGPRVLPTRGELSTLQPAPQQLSLSQPHARPVQQQRQPPEQQQGSLPNVFQMFPWHG